MELKVVIIPLMKKNNETENLEQGKSVFDTILEETRQISVWSLWLLVADVHSGLRSKGSKHEDMVAALLGTWGGFFGFWTRANSGYKIWICYLVRLKLLNEVECYRPLIFFRQILTLNWTLSISNRNGEGPDPLKTLILFSTSPALNLLKTWHRTKQLKRV